MEFESNGVDKAELRKRRRKKERTQALLILGGIVLALVLVIGIGISVIVKNVSGDKKSQQNEKAEITEEVVAQEEVDAAEETEEVDAGTMVETEAESEEVEEPEADMQEEVESTEDMDESGEIDESDAAEEEEGIVDEESISDDEQIATMIEGTIQSMSLESKIAQLFIITPAQLMGVDKPVLSVGSTVNEKYNAYPVGGIVLDENYITGEEEIQDLISNFQIYANNKLFVAIMDEGGEASPFVKSGVTENVIASQQEIGAELGISGAYSAGISLGSQLKHYGFNVDFAPMMDYALTGSSVAANRGFGASTAEENYDLARNVIKGLKDQNVSATVKYFPSYGDVAQDGSNGPVVSSRKKEDLEKEYEGYQDAIDAGADFVMVSHVALPKLRGDNRPASLSKEVITDIIRDEWGYDGIVITDYMHKSCIYQKYTYAEAAVGAIEAGADMLLSTKNFEKSYAGLLDAVQKGTITEERINESLRRIYRVKLRNS